MSNFTEGIYLEEKHSQLGTGHTSSNVVFKNYYVVRVLGDRLEMTLLDDHMNPTPIRETVGALAANMTLQPDLQERFNEIVAGMGAPPARPKPAAAPAAAPQAKPAPAPAAAAPAKPAAPAAPAAAPAAKPAAPAEKKKEPAGETPWWEMTSKGSGDLLK